MTYYGRWTYKYEEAARQGAAAALIIHDTAPAAYGWNVVESSWSGPQFYAQTANGGADQTKANGWIPERCRRQDLLPVQGHEIYVEKSRSAVFTPTALDMTASVTIKNEIKEPHPRT